LSHWIGARPTHIHGTHVPVVEPSTASVADIQDDGRQPELVERDKIDLVAVFDLGHILGDVDQPSSSRSEEISPDRGAGQRNGKAPALIIRPVLRKS
jgi:hypothetical protein